MITSFEYDTSYYPPIPVVEIGISHVKANDPAVKVIALVDSGADVTMLPLSLLKRANARYIGKAELSGVTDHSVPVSQYFIAIHLGGKIFRGIRAIGHKTIAEPIVGRDLLNRMRVTLDGPAETTEFA